MRSKCNFPCPGFLLPELDACEPHDDPERFLGPIEDEGYGYQNYATRGKKADEMRVFFIRVHRRQRCFPDINCTLAEYSSEIRHLILTNAGFVKLLRGLAV